MADLELTQEEQDFLSRMTGSAIEDKTKEEYVAEPDTSFSDFARSQGADVDKFLAEDEKENVTNKLATLQTTAGTPAPTSEVVGNPGKGVAFGLADVGQNIYNGAVDFLDWADNTAAEFGIGNGDLFNGSTKVNWSDKLPLSENDISGRTMRALTRYGAPVAATMAIGGLAGATAARSALTGVGVGALADFFLLDPKGDRLSNIILEEAPSLKNVPLAYDIVEGLAKKEGESEFKARVSNVIEGLGVGAVVAGGLVSALKLARGSKQAYSTVMKARPVKVADEATVAAAEAKMGTNAAEGAASVEDAGQFDLFDYAATRVNEDGTVKVNLNNDEMLAYVAEYAKANKGATFSRGPKNSVELVNEAQDVLKDPTKLQEMISWKLGSRPHKDNEVKATQFIIQDNAVNMVDIAKKYTQSKSKNDLVALTNAIEVHTYIGGVASGSGSEAGRALNAHKLAADLAGVRLSEFNKMLTAKQKAQLVDGVLKNAGGLENMDKVAKNLAAISELSPDDVAKKINKIALESKGNFKKFAELSYFTTVNGMMSAPATPIFNHLNNAQAALKMTVDNYSAALIGTLRGNQNAKTWGDANAYLWGQMSALGEGFVSMGEALKAGRGGPANIVKLDEFIPKNLAEQMDIPMERNQGYRLLGNVFNAYGAAVSVPTRLNGTADAFWGTLAYRGKLREIGLKNINNRGLKGKEADAFLDSFMKDPFVDDHNTAKAWAEEMTFAKALDPDTFAGKVDAMIAATPGGRTMFPFFKTTNNVISYTLNNSPLGPLLPYSKTREALKLGGAEADMAVAKVSSGSLLLAVGAWMYTSGQYSGADTPNWEVRRALTETDTGWMPNAVKRGDTWFDVSRLDYINSIMKLGSSLAVARNYLKDDEYQQYIGIASTAIADVMTPEMMVDSYARMMTAVGDLAQGRDTGSVGANIAGDVASRMLPFSGLLRSVKNVFDPYAGDTTVRSKDVNYFDEVLGKITARLKAQVPYFSESLPIQRNIFGEKITAPAGSLDKGIPTEYLSPFASRDAANTPLVKTLAKLAGFYEVMSPVDKELYELPISMPPRVISFQGVDIELTPHEYKDYVMYSAGLDPETGKPFGSGSLRDDLNTALKDLKYDYTKPMSSREYKALTSSFAKVISIYRKNGLMQMINTPKITERWQKIIDTQLELEDKGMRLE